MNLTELRDALDELAGPVEPPTSTDRQEVRRRVGRSRVIRATSAVVLALALLAGIVVATNWGRDDSATHVVTAFGTTVHDEKFGYTVTIPPGWEREPVETYPDDPIPMILSLSLGSTPLNLIAELAPIQSARHSLETQLDALPVDDADRVRLQRQIDALNNAEVEIRNRPDNRSTDCSPARGQNGIHIILQEGLGLSEPRPERFGPDSGTPLARDSSPTCPRLVQSMSFSDRGREFYTAITMAPDTTRERQAEVYEILNSLHFDTTTTVSTGGQGRVVTTTTFG